MFTTDLFRWVGIPAFAAFTLALHVWSVMLALALEGWLATAMTAFAPVLSWLAWSGYLWRETGTPLTAYGMAVAL